MVILGLILLLVTLRCAYLEVENRRAHKLLGQALRLARQGADGLRDVNTALDAHVATATVIADAVASNLRPIGNVDLVEAGKVVRLPERKP